MVTDLVAAGDPILKANAQKGQHAQTHIDELNLRIDELENAIGQSDKRPIGRAFAIRAETSNLNDSRIPQKNINLKTSPTKVKRFS